jgi:hypothetical protein
VTGSFRPGDPIAWRLHVRTDATRRTTPSYALAMTVVHDTPDEVALFRRPGHQIRIRNAEFDGPEHFRHRRVARWLDGWREDTWRQWRVLVLKRPSSGHAISLFWNDETEELAIFYIDLTSALRRTPVGFDFVENGLDVVVKPDLSEWHWKDEDELEWNVENGLFTKDEAAELYAEGERAVERLTKERDVFDRWRAWRPDPSWPIATLPEGWDRW